MIKVVSKITPAADGLDLDTEVLVAAPKSVPEEIVSLLIKAEIVALLKNMYKLHPDIIVDAIEEFTEDVEHDKTDINND